MKIALLVLLAATMGCATFKAGCPPDLNGDGASDAADASMIIAIAKSTPTPGRADWVPAADIDGDGVISLADSTLYIQVMSACSAEGILSWLNLL